MRGNQDNFTGKMFDAVTTVFMDGLQQAYGQVFATQFIMDEDDVVSLFTNIPTSDRRNELIVEMQRLTLQSRDTSRRHTPSDDDTRDKKRHKTESKKNTTATTSPSPATQQLQAEKFTAKFELMGKTEVDNSVNISQNLVGNDIGRYQKALMGYGFVIDSMFIWKNKIQQSLFSVLMSAVEFV